MAGRIGIDDVAPVVSGGRFPAKAVVGEIVPVRATVWREGHGGCNGRSGTTHAPKSVTSFRARAVLVAPRPKRPSQRPIGPCDLPT